MAFGHRLPDAEEGSQHTFVDHRRRKSPEKVIEDRRLRAIAAPLTKDLSIWHARAAYLGAKIDYAIQHGEPVEHLAASIDGMTSEVRSRFGEWHSHVAARTDVGVLDVERSCRAMIARLQEMRARILPTKEQSCAHQ